MYDSLYTLHHFTSFYIGRYLWTCFRYTQTTLEHMMKLWAINMSPLDLSLFVAPRVSTSISWKNYMPATPTIYKRWHDSRLQAVPWHNHLRQMPKVFRSAWWALLYCDLVDGWIICDLTDADENHQKMLCHRWAMRWGGLTRAPLTGWCAQRVSRSPWRKTSSCSTNETFDAVPSAVALRRWPFASAAQLSAVEPAAQIQVVLLSAHWVGETNPDKQLQQNNKRSKIQAHHNVAMCC